MGSCNSKDPKPSQNSNHKISPNRQDLIQGIASDFQRVSSLPNFNDKITGYRNIIKRLKPFEQNIHDDPSLKKLFSEIYYQTASLLALLNEKKEARDKFQLSANYGHMGALNTLKVYEELIWDPPARLGPSQPINQEALLFSTVKPKIPIQPREVAVHPIVVVKNKKDRPDPTRI